MKIVQIGAIVLDHPMWIEEELDSQAVEAEVVDNLDGGVIVFEQNKRVSKQEVTLQSRNDGWQSKITLTALLSLANGSLGQSYQVVDSDAGTFNVRFRHETRDGAIQFERVVGVKQSEWYSGIIYLAKV